jgi:hypothetical protein
MCVLIVEALLMEGKDIYILLVFALPCWRRPTYPVDDAKLADAGTRSIFQQIL